jgi:hypothetical protein
MAFNLLRNLLPDSTNVFELRGLRYADDDREPVGDDSVVELTIYNVNGAPVPGESWPKIMVQHGTTTEDDGVVCPIWRCKVSHLARMFRSTNYRVTAIARAPDGSQREFSALYEAQSFDH